MCNKKMINLRPSELFFFLENLAITYRNICLKVFLKCEFYHQMKWLSQDFDFSSKNTIWAPEPWKGTVYQKFIHSKLYYTASTTHKKMRVGGVISIVATDKYLGEFEFIFEKALAK
jgi:hypothetical protein